MLATPGSARCDEGDGPGISDGSDELEGVSLTGPIAMQRGEQVLPCSSSIQDVRGARTQGLPGAYFGAGQFHFGRIHSCLKDRSLSATNTMPLVLSSTEVVDMDTEDKWRLLG